MGSQEFGPPLGAGEESYARFYPPPISDDDPANSAVARTDSHLAECMEFHDSAVVSSLQRTIMLLREQIQYKNESLERWKTSHEELSNVAAQNALLKSRIQKLSLSLEHSKSKNDKLDEELTERRDLVKNLQHSISLKQEQMAKKQLELEFYQSQNDDLTLEKQKLQTEVADLKDQLRVVREQNMKLGDLTVELEVANKKLKISRVLLERKEIALGELRKALGHSGVVIPDLGPRIIDGAIENPSASGHSEAYNGQPGACLHNPSDSMSTACSCASCASGSSWTAARDRYDPDSKYGLINRRPQQRQSHHQRFAEADDPQTMYNNSANAMASDRKRTKKSKAAKSGESREEKKPKGLKKTKSKSKTKISKAKLVKRSKRMSKRQVSMVSSSSNKETTFSQREDVVRPGLQEFIRLKEAARREHERKEAEKAEEEERRQRREAERQARHLRHLASKYTGFQQEVSPLPPFLPSTDFCCSDASCTGQCRRRSAECEYQGIEDAEMTADLMAAMTPDTDRGAKSDVSLTDLELNALGVSDSAEVAGLDASLLEAVQNHLAVEADLQYTNSTVPPESPLTLSPASSDVSGDPLESSSDLPLHNTAPSTTSKNHHTHKDRLTARQVMAARRAHTKMSARETKTKAAPCKIHPANNLPPKRRSSATSKSKASASLKDRPKWI